jgi:hypothetical protein
MAKFSRLAFGQAAGSPITPKSRPRNSEHIQNTGCSTCEFCGTVDEFTESYLCEEHSLIILNYKTALIAESCLVVRSIILVGNCLPTASTLLIQ